ncbi:MAG: BsuBI/PstI family type II restriction endonuclease [Caldilineaceae bacterium]
MSQYAIVDNALNILIALGLPRAQQNERSALTLLALLNLTSEKQWNQAEAKLIGITPIMDFIRENYGKNYAPNTRETIRRQTMHQFVAAALATYNPDDPYRPVNSPKAVYQIATDALTLFRLYGTEVWNERLEQFIAEHGTLQERYARPRQQKGFAVSISLTSEIHLSPGMHSKLIKEVVEEFAPRFVPGSRLIYVGDTGEKWGYFDQALLESLGVKVDSHGKMPDVVLYYAEKNWIILVEAVTSHGPVDGKRHEELAQLFSTAAAGLIYVTAFPTRRMMTRYLSAIAWETEVWIAENLSHLIHFDGERFLGPYTH